MYYARPNNKRSAVSVNAVETSDLKDKSLDGNFKTLKVNDASVLTATDVSGKVNKSGDTMTGTLTLNTLSFTGLNPYMLIDGQTDPYYSIIPEQIANVTNGNLNYCGAILPYGSTTAIRIGSFFAASGTPLYGTAFTGDQLVNAWSGKFTGTNVINMGSDVSGKETNAGKIGYQMTTAGTLDIYGAGTTAGSRNIKLWDNVTLPGTLKSNIMSVGTSTNAAITSYLEVGYGEYKQIHAGKIYYNSTLGTVDIVGGGTTTPRSIRLLENVSIAGTLGVTGITTLSGGFNATGGAIQVTKSNQANLGTVTFTYSDLGSPPIGYYVWTIRRTDQTWAAAEDNWAMGRVTINTTSGIVNHWVDTSSNLAVSASSTGFTFMNTTGVTASFVMRLNRLI